MATASKTYEAFFFRQRPKAPVECVFVATSADVFDWAAVPTKTSKDLRNFQRPEIQPHVDEIKEFFSNHEENCSPSAIVVGFRRPPRCLDESSAKLNLSKISVGQLVRGRVEISYTDPVDLDVAGKRQLLSQTIGSEIAMTEALIAKLKTSLDSSGVLSADSSRDVAGEEDTATETVSVVGSDAEEDEKDSEADDDAMAVADDSGGASVDALDLLDEDVARLNELKLIRVEDLSDPQVDEFLTVLLDRSKPGLIIDGQHRIRGTKNEKIYFPVTALPDATWPELAFQFIVQNRTARQVPDRLLINIVGKSLTPEELSGIEKRLNDSGIPVPLYQGVMKLHEDPDSPFYGKLKFLGVKGESGIIDAASAKTKIVNFWFDCGALYPLVKHMLPGKTRRERVLAWQTSGLWYQFLKVFWNEAKTLYEHSTLWSNEVEKDGKTPVSRLMRVTITNLTQVAVIQQMAEDLTTMIKGDIKGVATMPTLLPDIDAFHERAKFYFKRLKADFFQDWGDAAKGFDGSKHIRDKYVEAVKFVVSGSKTIESLKKEGKDQHLLYKSIGA